MQRLPRCTYVALTSKLLPNGVHRICPATWCRILPPVHCTIVLIPAYANLADMHMGGDLNYPWPPVSSHQHGETRPTYGALLLQGLRQGTG